MARARKYYGKSLDNRITKARHYLLNDQIEIDGQFAFVPSETDPESHYTVSSEGCDCQDAEYTAPQGMCAHRLAWDILRGAWREIRKHHREAPVPIPDPYTDPAPGVERPADSPLPEAAISITMRGTFAGMPGTLVTLRGWSMSEIAARAEQVKAQAACLAGIFEAPSAPAAPLDDDEDGDEDGDEEVVSGFRSTSPPLCPAHDTEMKRSKFGGWYCPQRIDDDEFCPEKIKPKAK